MCDLNFWSVFWSYAIVCHPIDINFRRLDNFGVSFGLCMRNIINTSISFLRDAIEV